MSADIENAMFCYQCEQTIGGTGCTKIGRCHKTPEMAAIQDVQMMGVQRLACVAKPHWASMPAALRDDVVRTIVESTFMTLTNVSFDPARHHAQSAHIKALIDQCLALGGTPAPAVEAVAAWTPATDPKLARIDLRQKRLGKTVVGLQELIVYGMKGVSAYMDHALRLGVRRAEADDFLVEVFSFLANEPTDIGALLGMALKLGSVNLVVMEALNEANTKTYGDPTPTTIAWAPFARREGKCILVSGHDLLDMYELLVATKDTGISVYTHGEMLTANSYPGLKAQFPHLAGHYGTAWQNQQKEFKDFPGAILMTTNCVIPRVSEYSSRIFTAGLVGVPGVTHIPERGADRFAPVIAAAQAAPGFVGTVEAGSEHKKDLTIGFGLKTVASVADQLLSAVGAGKLRRIFLVGGCDGFEGSRNYYTDLAAQVPADCLILTLACGKFKLNQLEHGTIDLGAGVVLPRLLDLGQCNDSHTAITAAKVLAAKAGCSPNELPLSIVLSWFEQKAVCILLSLLSLGIRNIRVGPALPAFLSPEALAVLVEKFALTPIGATAAADLAVMLPTPAAAQ